MTRRRKETDTIIVPTGACEIYGPHLPMGADAIAAMAISERVAERTGSLIAPMIPIGESNSLTCYPGTITFSKSTFELIIKELFENLVKYGFKHFLFVTGHAGNVDAISYYAKTVSDQIRHQMRTDRLVEIHKHQRRRCI